MHQFCIPKCSSLAAQKAIEGWNMLQVRLGVSLHNFHLQPNVTVRNPCFELNMMFDLCGNTAKVFCIGGVHAAFEHELPPRSWFPSRWPESRSCLIRIFPLKSNTIYSPTSVSFSGLMEGLGRRQLLSSSSVSRFADESLKSELYSTVHYEASGKMHPCPKCPYSTWNQKAIDDHMKSVHDNMNEAACKLCEHMAPSEQQLRRHMRAHKKNLMCGNGKCSYRTSYRWALEEHVKDAHDNSEEDDFTCGQCSYKTVREGELKRHVRINHDKGSERVVDSEKMNERLMSEYV